MNNELMKTSNLPAEFEQYSSVKIEDNDGLKLSMRQREIAFLVAIKSTTKMSMQDIADRYQISREMVYRETRTPDFQKYLKKITEDIYGEMFTLATLAMKDILENGSNAHKIKVIGYVLQAEGKLKNDHTLEIKQHQQTLTDLEKEVEVLEMELELLGE
ncbi:putative DNA-binding protein YlxM (UPF0122 family) [Neobacillus niacini]|uniref:phBC6A51 family helix-turn-helix protein n=1 Tax=Neobacillus niacini TaxID=86668 RepID=UPI002856A6B7|nr:phBC6A51 family helix-turn-helix protein [Neobacillus niacini]MDR7076192.1 putative DNA-binding protein YlxM (UPF0122 family) [Neobacillus niacini]